MITVFAMAAALWGIGALMKMPARARLYMIGLLYIGVLFVQIALPLGHPLRMATGESAALWILIGVFAAVAVLYGRVIKGLKDRALVKEGANAPWRETRCQRQRGRSGGLGAACASCFRRRQRGDIGVMDDAVENGFAQVIHRDQDIGMPKVFSAQAAMMAQNPYVEVRPYHRRLTEAVAADLVGEYDLTRRNGYLTIRYCCS